MDATLMSDREKPANHWNEVYRTRAETEVSWFQTSADLSLELIENAGQDRAAPVLDVGAGASTLVDGLLARGFTDVTLLDIASTAFDAVRARIGERGEVTYVAADITTWTPPRQFMIWHDRAVFHFMTTDEQRAAYRRALGAAVPRGGHVILATFAEDGPERCSGLSVSRYSADELALELAGLLTLVAARRHVHTTPKGAPQGFTFALFTRN